MIKEQGRDNLRHSLIATSSSNLIIRPPTSHMFSFQTHPTQQTWVNVIQWNKGISVNCWEKMHCGIEKKGWLNNSFVLWYGKKMLR